MSVITMARRLAPMVVLSACLLSGCQSIQSIGAEPLAFAAVTDIDEGQVRTSSRQIERTFSGDANASEASTSERTSAWRERARERREAFRERLEKRRAERQNRTVALRSFDNEREERRSIRFSHLDDRDGRSSRWGIYNRSQKSRSKRTNVGNSSGTPKGKYGALIAKYAKQHGVPVRLARAVVQVESSFRPNVTGGAGEIGLMQIKYATAKGMGYRGSRQQLYDPATNLYWGMKYLGKAHSLAGGSTCGTILRYNAGHYAKRMNPISARYCKRVSQILA